jgi:hypothetical protein
VEKGPAIAGEPCINRSLFYLRSGPWKYPDKTSKE